MPSVLMQLTILCGEWINTNPYCVISALKTSKQRMCKKSAGDTIQGYLQGNGRGGGGKSCSNKGELE